MHINMKISPIPNSLDFSLQIEIVCCKFGIFVGSYKPITGLLTMVIYLLSVIYFLISLIKSFGSFGVYSCLIRIS